MAHWNPLADAFADALFPTSLFLWERLIKKKSRTRGDMHAHHHRPYKQEWAQTLIEPFLTCHAWKKIVKCIFCRLSRPLSPDPVPLPLYLCSVPWPPLKMTKRANERAWTTERKKQRQHYPLKGRGHPLVQRSTCTARFLPPLSAVYWTGLHLFWTNIVPLSLRCLLFQGLGLRVHTQLMQNIKEENTTRRPEYVTTLSSSPLFQIFLPFLFFFSFSCFWVTTSPSTLTPLIHPFFPTHSCNYPLTALPLVLFSSVHLYRSLKSPLTPVHVTDSSPVWDLSISTASFTPLFPYERSCDGSHQTRYPPRPKPRRSKWRSPKIGGAWDSGLI